MTGGLLQMVTSGKQDVYLTINPEITFFKKVYKRYTNFSLELKEIYAEQSVNYNSIISFNIKNGDILHRCYLEITLPTLSFSDNYINDNNYINSKNNKLNILNFNYNKWNNYYINLKNYVDIEIQLYSILYNLLLINNITIESIKKEVLSFNHNVKNYKDKYKNNIDPIIFNLIDISGYILSINKLINSNLDNNIYISIITINLEIKKRYNNIIKYISFYNKKKNYYNTLINNINQSNQINFCYAKYLGHIYFNYFSIEIGGIEIQKYSNYHLHINQMHNIKEDYMNNYNEMIGNIDNLNNYNNNTKNNDLLLVPLIFWFNKDVGASLPLIAMQYSDVIINAKINDIRNIICFEDYEYMFEDILNLDVDNNSDTEFILDTGFILNYNLIYTNFKIDPHNNIINYKCIYINNTLLKIKFPDITNDEINYILTTYGTQYDSNQLLLLNPNINISKLNNIDYWLINKIQWVNFMINIKSYPYNPYKISSYYSFIDFNLYYSLIKEPNIKLICEFVYLDDMERATFANSKLEYVIEIVNEDIYNFSNNSFDCDLNINNPCKELIWFIQPSIFINGLNANGKNLQLLFDTKEYFTNNYINNQAISLNQYELLLPSVDNNYYTYLSSYKYLNNILPIGIFYYSFCLFPEETQPSGTINLRYIKGKQYNVTIDNKFNNEYNNLINTLKLNINNLYTLMFISKCYDLLVIHKGKVNLIFVTS